MKSSEAHADPASAYRPKEYWSGVASSTSGDVTGFAPVLHPDAPAWFNQLIDDLQSVAVRRALLLADVRSGASMLDVGCGTGRWLRRYIQMGLQVTGVDATPPMLQLALERGTEAPVAAGVAQNLPFATERFDCVSDVTVVQHIPTALQGDALGEMVRVLRPGGRLILVELIRGEGLHVFPRSPQDWIEEVASRGARLLGWFGQEFLVLDRLFVRAARTLVSRQGDSGPHGGTSQRTSLARRAYWAVRHVTAPLSGWIDPAVSKVIPGKMATHGVFVFQKES
jgi:SAM-dependent methyltransferase